MGIRSKEVMMMLLIAFFLGGLLLFVMLLGLIFLIKLITNRKNPIPGLIKTGGKTKTFKNISHGGY